MRELFGWQRLILRAQSLSKLAVKIAIELSMSVDRNSGSRDAGYAVRSHQWFVDQFGSTRGKVIEAIAGLENLGFLTVKRSTRKGIPNRYLLTFPSASSSFDGSDDVLPF